MLDMLDRLKFLCRLPMFTFWNWNNWMNGVEIQGEAWLRLLVEFTMDGREMARLQMIAQDWMLQSLENTDIQRNLKTLQ